MAFQSFHSVTEVAYPTNFAADP
jgi:hypothetical protein